MQGNKRVSQTAYATAQFWAAAGFEHAELFASRRGWVAHQGLRLGQWLGRPFLPAAISQFDRYTMARHRAFELQLSAYQPTAVIEIAAGLSSRGLSFGERQPNLAYLEVDLPDLLAEKQARLSKVKQPSNLALLAADALANDFAAQVLAQPLLQGKLQRLLIISEGLQDYLNADEKQQLWRSVGQIMTAAESSCYSFEAWPVNRLGHSPWLDFGLLGLSRLTGQNMRSRLFADAEAVLAAAQAAGLVAPKLVSTEVLAPAFDDLDPQSSPWQLFAAGDCGA